MRRILITFLLIAFVLLGAVTALPWCLGAALHHFGPAHGLTFSSYERKGYAHFGLRDAVFERTGLRVTAETLDADTPLLWSWRLWQDKTPKVVLGRWAVQVTETNPTPPPSPQHRVGLVPLQAQLDAIALQLRRWLPSATLGPGEVTWPDGKLALASARWRDGVLEIDQLVGGGVTADVVLHSPKSDGNHLWLIEAKSAARDATAKASLKNGHIDGAATWLGQPATFTAEFPDRGWKPAEAHLHLAGWTVPGERLQAGQYFKTVTGGADVLWQAGRLKISANAAGTPTSGDVHSPLNVGLQAEGDADAISIQALHLSFPGAEADLTKPVLVGRDGRMRSADSVFSFKTDLSRLPWFKAAGLVAGEVKITAGQAIFTLTADKVAAFGEQVEKVRASGTFAGQKLTIASADIDVVKGTRLAFSGGWDFATKEVFAAKLSGRVNAAAIRRWLPPDFDFANADITAEASGPLAKLAHHGQISATLFKWGRSKLMTLRADWQGAGKELSAFFLNAEAGEAGLQAHGSLSGNAVELAELTLSKKKATQLKLESPVRIAWQPGVSVENFHLSGPAGSLAASVIWAPEGKLDVTVTHFTPAWVDDWIELRNADWAIPTLQVQGAWKKGPMTFTLQGEGSFALGQDRLARLSVKASGNGDGAKIETLKVSEASGNIVNATGSLPVRFYPAQGPVFQWSDAEEFNLQAATEPNTEFWQKLTEISGLELVNPRVNLNLKGTRSTVQGAAKIQVDRISMDPKKIRQALPTIEGLEVELSGDASRIKVDKFSLMIERQAVHAAGALALVHGFWAELQGDPLAYIQNHGTFHLDVPDAEVSAFTRFLPNVLSPVGRIVVDLDLKDGGHLDGSVKLSQAASRPLGPLGILQDIGADVRFDDRTIKLQSVEAKSGGQPVTLTGKVELVPGAEPRYDVALKGENIPFVRQMGLLLRGDLDLKLTTPASGPPQVTGKARLRDSLFLADVRSFIPSGGGQTTSSRPPYFAVQTAPLNAWVLNVDISGQRFMRLQTPVFTGTVSAQFKLGGTLGSPRVVGDATVDQGRVLMPFVSFNVGQGSVRLTEANPYEPTLYVRGTARRFNYDLTFELTGTTSRPVVVFTSSPALDSEQVLLMVMTGSAPSNEVTSTTTQRAARIGAFLGQGLFDSVRGGSGGDDHLSIVSGEKISRQGRETYDIEYGLSERWALTGEYDEFDDYNIGVKWLMFRDRPWKKEEDKDEKK